MHLSYALGAGCAKGVLQVKMNKTGTTVDDPLSAFSRIQGIVSDAVKKVWNLQSAKSIKDAWVWTSLRW